MSMYPTLLGSMRNALHTLGSLVVGILLAAAVLVFSQLNAVTLSVAVGVGALIAAAGWFGNNREYIPVTVVFGSSGAAHTPMPTPSDTSCKSASAL